jgi:hypothetical protein
MVMGCSTGRSRVLGPESVVSLEDAGSALAFEDGSVAVPLFAGSPGSPGNGKCAADAGTLLRLMAELRCDQDSECGVFFPEIDSDQFEYCYPIRRGTAGSAEFKWEYRALERACGHVTVLPTESCRTGGCRSGQCVAVRVGDGGW